MSRLREIHLTRVQLAALAALSAAATVLIVADALGRTGAQAAALQALRHRSVIVEQHPSKGVATASPPNPTSDPPLTDPVASIAPGGSSSSAPSAASAATTTTGTAPSSSSSGSGSGSAAPGASAEPGTTSAPKSRVKHVFVIALSTTSFDAAFGRDSVAPYLNRTLRRRGTLLAGYQTLGPSELPDYLAMIAGQAPNLDTEAECTTYSEFPTGAAPNANGIVPGLGCVYPNTVLTIGDQVTASGHGWRAYVQDMGSSTCVHPNSDAVDDVPLPGAGDDYDTSHNPFIYFHSLLDLGGCASNDVSLTQLPTDLRSASTAPAYAFIAPEGCLDASASSCPDGGLAGLAGEDAFLEHVVPRILGSPAYKRGGVLIIAFAHSASGSEAPQGTPIRTGALVLSPYAGAGKRVSTTYDPYSLLRSVENLLGYAPLASAKSASSFIAKALPGLG